MQKRMFLNIIIFIELWEHGAYFPFPTSVNSLQALAKKVFFMD